MRAGTSDRPAPIVEAFDFKPLRHRQSFTMRQRRDDGTFGWYPVSFYVTNRGRAWFAGGDRGPVAAVGNRAQCILDRRFCGER